MERIKTVDEITEILENIDGAELNIVLLAFNRYISKREGISEIYAKEETIQEIVFRAAETSGVQVPFQLGLVIYRDIYQRVVDSMRSGYRYELDDSVDEWISDHPDEWDIHGRWKG